MILNSYPCDGIFSPQFTIINDSYIPFLVPLLYETVQELLNDQLAVPDFTTALFEEDGDRMNRGYKWNPRDLYRKSQM